MIYTGVTGVKDVLYNKARLCAVWAHREIPTSITFLLVSIPDLGGNEHAYDHSLQQGLSTLCGVC